MWAGVLFNRVNVKYIYVEDSTHNAAKILQKEIELISYMKYT